MKQSIAAGESRIEGSAPDAQMAATTQDLHAPNGARLRLLTFPREHGAWGILLVPLTTGAAIGYRSPEAIFPSILFALTALSLFWLRTPLESYLATSPVRPRTVAERRAVQYSIVATAAIAAASLAEILRLERAWDLLLLGAAVGAIFLFQTVLKKLSRKNRLGAQLTGALALTSTAAAAYYVAAQKLDATALVLWGVNWLFASNQIYFVQLRIHAARLSSGGDKLKRGWPFLAGEMLTLGLLVGLWKLHELPGFALLAFALVLGRGASWPFSDTGERLQVRRLGVSELFHAILFGVLLIISYRLRGM
jgi:YwiC-like protein